MQLSNAPSKIIEPFAVNAAPSGGYGGKRTVPVPSQTGITPGAASFNDGFPPLTMTPIPGGGVVMSGLDMNGVLNQISAIDNWKSAGGSWQYDSVYSAAIGGYPKGARLLNAAGTDFWTSIVDNNATDPDTGGAGWIPSRATSSVHASVQQTLASGNSKVLWDTVDFDFYSLWNSGSSRFVAKWAGKYRFNGAVYLPSPAGTAGQNLTAMIYQNGALIRQIAQFPADSDQPITIPFDAILSCAVNDYLEAYLNLSVAGALAGVPSGNNAPYVYGQIEFLGL